MRGFAFTSMALLGCLALSGIVTIAQAKSASGGIQMLSFVPEAELQEENRFWRNLLDQVSDCETTEGAETRDGALASACPTMPTPKAPTPQPGKAGA